MKQNQVYMGTFPRQWGKDKNVKTITFSITDECNLRCTYCYFTHKTAHNIMDFKIAQKAVDNILTDKNNDMFDGVIWEFIGGEPTIEMDLIDKISDYILYKMYSLNHKWLNCYRFMIGTNGLLYDSDKVQQYIKKHGVNLYMAITIDGSKEKHDLSRIKKDGSGSYDDVVRIIPLWLKQFKAESTKATFSHDDLPFLKESIINLWNLGIKNIAANVVFEDVWHDGDDEIFKQQLYELADYIIENDLWDKYSVRFFDPNVGTPINDNLMNINFCGTGTMLAINTQGDYYPCVRFMPSALNKHNFTKLGDIESGINTDRIRPFYILSTQNQSNEECLNCDISGGCAWCSGFNYDDSSVGTIYERQTHICKMHKANVEVNKYLWRQYELIKKRISPYRFNKLNAISKYNKYLYIICRTDFPSYCDYSIERKNLMEMDNDMIDKAIDYCEKNNFVPIFCGCNKLPENYYGYQMITYEDYISGKCTLNDNYDTQLLIRVNQISNEIELPPNIVNIIITLKASQIDKLLDAIELLSNKLHNASINIRIQEIDVYEKKYITNYSSFLEKMNELILNSWINKNYLSVSSITHELFANNNRYCGAGKNSYALLPNGKFYLCPGFYMDDEDSDIGNLDQGLKNKFEKYCDAETAPLCKNCSIKHCKRCILTNKFGTGEYHIPTELQCVISNIEYIYSKKLIDKINEISLELPFEFNKKLPPIENLDPLKNIRGNSFPNRGLDNYFKTIKN